MWRKFLLNEKTFLLRSSNGEGKFRIFMSDLLNLWFEDLTEEQLLQRCKEMNPLHEASTEVLIQRIKELIELNGPDVKTQLTESNAQLSLNISSHLRGIIFRIQFILALGSPEMFFKQMTSPLIRMVSELKGRQEKLFNLLLKKDLEIDEYKMGGMKLTRKNIETAPFNEQEFIKRFPEVENQRLCASTSFLEHCNDLYEGCIKNIEDAVSSSSPEEKTVKEDTGTEVSESDKQSTSLKTSKNRRVKGIVFKQDDDDDSDNDDETQFNDQPQITAKTERNENIPVKKKRSRIQDMF